jgi:hypothetical protein
MAGMLSGTLSMKEAPSIARERSVIFCPFGDAKIVNWSMTPSIARRRGSFGFSFSTDDG